MSTYPLHALVLGKTKLSESDLIMTLLAEDGSQVRAVAKGIRKTRSRLRGVVEVFAEVSLLCATGRNLDIITEARLVDAHEGCRCSYERICAAEVVCELARKLTYADNPQEKLFDMIQAALCALEDCEEESLRLLACAAMLKMVSLVGYRPLLTSCTLCGTCLDAAVRRPAFSIDAGGMLCDDCAARVPHINVPRELLRWAETLVRSTFAEICGYHLDEGITTMLLELASDWIGHHAGVQLRSLQYLQGD